MAGPNISEPFILATYTSTLRGTVLDKSLSGAYASVHQGLNKSDEFVTVAAQADAVHVVDVSNLHPVLSHTLGLSTFFSCPPLTFSTSKSAWTTYAVISSSPELPSIEDAGRTIYMWKVDSATKEKQCKTTKTLFEEGQNVHGLYACHELKGKIIALSSIGDATILDAESLEIASHWSSSTDGSTVKHAWLLSMVPMNLKLRAFVVIIYSGASNTAHLRILAIDEADSISQVKDENIELSVDKILDASCNPSGYLSVLTTDALWFLYNLLPFLDAIEATSLPSNRTEPLRLANFSWLDAPSLSKPPVTIISLTSSHALLATISSHEIILLVWDLRFGVVLASYNLPIPGSLASSSTLDLDLVGDQENLCRPPLKTNILPNSQVSGQAYLLVSSAVPNRKETSGAHKESKVTSVIFVIPYTIPRLSTLASAMGRGSFSQQWLKDDHSSKTTTDRNATTEDASKNKLLRTLQAALQDGRTQAGEATFLKWVSTVKEENRTSTFEYNFVQELLTTIFTIPSDSRQRTKATYPAQIINNLLERGVISSAMVASHGGLLSLLRTRNDWKSIELAFSSVPDLGEMEIVETLMIILAYHRRSSPSTQNTSGPEDAMQVDTVPASQTDLDSLNPTPLETFLHLMMNYPTTRIPLLLAFRRHLQDPEDVTILLRILSDWLAKSERAAEEECLKLLPGREDIKKTSEGVWIVSVKTNTKQTQKIVPSLEKIINHISTLLDSSFLSLLSYKPSHETLRTIASQTAPELAFIHAAQRLIGGLEPFAILQEKTLRESLVPKAEKEKEKQKVDWRKRRKGVGAATGGPEADVGIYTVEELVL